MVGVVGGGPFACVSVCWPLHDALYAVGCPWGHTARPATHFPPPRLHLLPAPLAHVLFWFLHTGIRLRERGLVPSCVLLFPLLAFCSLRSLFFTPARLSPLSFPAPSRAPSARCIACYLMGPWS